MASEVLLLDSGVWIATVDDEDRFESASRELVFDTTMQSPLST
jgi:PIN domain nuclease of toxin-antitoxin system